MHHHLSSSLSKLFLVCVTYGFQRCTGNPTCRFPYQRTDGKYFVSKVGKYYAGQPLQTILNSTISKCSMIFSAGFDTQSMNVLGNNQSDVICQLFERKAIAGFEDGILENKEDSTYYEKAQYFSKATLNTVVVEAKDDKPGNFTFVLPTGKYQIRLNYLSGSLYCSDYRQHTLPFGCQYPFQIKFSQMRLYKEYRDQLILYASDFDEYGGDDGANTIYLATSECISLIEGADYWLWYYQDAIDSQEQNNSGEITFDVVAQMCEKENQCV